MSLEVQRAIGWLCALVFFAIAYLSLEESAALAWPVILGMIVVIALLLGQVENLAKLAELFRR